MLTSGNSIALPSRFATDEMPPGTNGFTVAEQVFICGGGGLFCDNYVTGGGTLIAQDNFRDALRVDTMTLTGFAPGQPFSTPRSWISRRIAGLFRSRRPSRPDLFNRWSARLVVTAAANCLTRPHANARL